MFQDNGIAAADPLHPGTGGYRGLNYTGRLDIRIPLSIIAPAPPDTGRKSFLTWPGALVLRVKQVALPVQQNVEQAAVESLFSRFSPVSRLFGMAPFFWWSAEKGMKKATFMFL